jgi:hypothetical protein
VCISEFLLISVFLQQQGKCCPPTSVCGNSCCPLDTQHCVAQAFCCNPEDDCGSKCCNPIDPLAPPDGLLLIPPLTCVDRINQVCCQKGQKSINGVCCFPGQIVMDGICCAPGNVACNGQCCLGTCDSKGQCHFSITDAECIASGHNQGSCSTWYPSFSCSFCTTEGCCIPAPK